MRQDNIREFCVVGGGASGLSAADALRKQGHEDVVVLEREPSVGGKCSTLHYEGRTYELGAAIVTPTYHHVRELMHEHGVKPTLRLSASFMHGSPTRIARFPFVPPKVGLSALRLLFEVGRLWYRALGKQRAVFPRLDLSDPELAQPFESWARDHGLNAVLELIRPWATSFGYGHLDEVPAAYVINYMCVMGASFELHESGYGGLWQRVARGLDVRVDTRAERVTRHADHVEVVTNRGVVRARKLIIACPLDLALNFLDASAEERALFSQIRHTDYQVVAANTVGMPPQSYVFLPENFGRDAHGKPMFYYRRYADTGVITFYSFRGDRGLDGAAAEVESLVRRCGGRVTQILTQRSYHYFPHVTQEAMEDGFHRRVEALQGVNNTYYLGEVLSFSCVEPVVAYSRDLVKRCFPALHTVDLGAREPENTTLRKTG